MTMIKTQITTGKIIIKKLKKDFLKTNFIKFLTNFILARYFPKRVAKQ